ncbi:MAG: hypothetical protein NC832_01835 [Candidatus Omnitrophica bacterium]|nr:hypothetical protein [Candidatus Omnitrophota bacterium]
MKILLKYPLSPLIEDVYANMFPSIWRVSGREKKAIIPKIIPMKGTTIIPTPPINIPIPAARPIGKGKHNPQLSKTRGRQLPNNPPSIIPQNKRYPATANLFFLVTSATALKLHIIKPYPILPKIQMIIKVTSITGWISRRYSNRWISVGIIES